jgi:hypothetical protein
MHSRILFAVVGSWLLSGCSVAFMREAEPRERLQAPPPGKALVNFHRPSSMYNNDDLPVFDREKLIGNTKGSTGFQYVCDPGEHVFLAAAEQVTVIKAQLLPDKTYDVVCDAGMGWWSANLKLVPMEKAEPRRPKIPEWEESETLVVFVADEKAQAYEAKRREANAAILKDFLGGPKAERVTRLEPGDHR